LTARLSGLTIGALTLSPEFNPDVLSYAATTSNATNKVTATVEDEADSVEITVNGAAHENGTAAAWIAGENTLTVKVASGSAETIYTVTVTKS